MKLDDLSPSIHDIRWLHDNQCSFLLGTLKTRVHLRVHADGNDSYQWEQSHFIHTPLQIDAYRTSRPESDTDERAWHSAFDTLVRWYDDAVRAGRSPEESWLVPNQNWRQ